MPQGAPQGDITKGTFVKGHLCSYLICRRYERAYLTTLPNVTPPQTTYILTFVQHSHTSVGGVAETGRGLTLARQANEFSGGCLRTSCPVAFGFGQMKKGGSVPVCHSG